MDLSWYVPETYKNDKIKATTKHHKNMLWKREKIALSPLHSNCTLYLLRTTPWEDSICDTHKC